MDLLWIYTWGLTSFCFVLLDHHLGLVTVYITSKSQIITEQDI